MSVKIVVDSACDLSPSTAESLGLTFLPLRTILGTEEYLDGLTLTPREFYEKLIETDLTPTTSQIPPADYEAAFEKIVADGDTVLCITVSSTLSGCYQSANIAPERVFSLCVAANTTMNHLFVGTDAEPVRTEPYIPAFFAWDDLLARDLNLPANKQARLMLAPIHTVESMAW